MVFGQASVIGLERSTAGTWEAIELSLAHTIGTSVSQAYFQDRPIVGAQTDDAGLGRIS